MTATNKEKSGQNHSVSNRLIPISIADEISKLKELQFNGIISEAEFENQKQKLLNS
ncbi:MAG: SHOCT domain-containing protein [Ignavibacteriales bacterium]|nr:SHOCT domain-containing protein [Ignavibacteriales bacterium]